MQITDIRLVNIAGVIAYHKKSLDFAIEDGTLLLQSGAALTYDGSYITLNEPSYILCENITQSVFENGKHYYFYLYKEKNAKEDKRNYLLHKEIAQGISFIVSEAIEENMIFLGEIDIDYKEDEGNEAIHIAKNAFAPRTNEIDIRQRNNIYVKNNHISAEERHWFSAPLYDLAETLHKKMKNENALELCTFASAFFTFYETVETSNLSCEELYHKCKHHTKLLSWIETSRCSEDTKKYLQLLKAQISEKMHTYENKFYAIDKDNTDGFFHCYIHYIKNLTEALKSSEYHDKNNANKTIIELSKDISKNENYEFEAVLPESFMIEEEVEEIGLRHDDIENTHEDTVLVGNSSRRFIQIGRSENLDNDIVLDKEDASISRVHARITAYKEGFFIEDLSSLGTYVDGDRIEKNTKKFVTTDSHIVLGKNGYVLDLSDDKIQALHR